MTIDAAYVGFIVALLGAGGVIVWAVANFLKTQLKTLNDLVGDLRKEVGDLRQQDRANELEIRDLLKARAELAELKLQMEKLRGELAAVRNELENVKQAREERERQLAEERGKRESAEKQFRELQEIFVKERSAWMVERDSLNERIAALQGKMNMAEQRLDAVEGVRATPPTEIPAVKVDDELRPTA